MTLKGGTSQACAACKYQRRRCTSECPLAPYFPPDQPKVFQNAHRLFGVSNILKILKKIEPEQRAMAMWSIIYESNQRARDPVRGCLGVICQLRNMIWQEEQEFMAVQAQLELYRQQQGLELVMAPPSGHVGASVPPTQQEVCFNADGHGTAAGANPAWMQYPCRGADGIGMIQQPCMLSGPPAPLDVEQDYDEMPFFDTMDDRQSYVDSKEAYDSSSEESALKETNQPMPSMDLFVDNDLRDAAAGLRLTSVN